MTFSTLDQLSVVKHQVSAENYMEFSIFHVTEKKCLTQKCEKFLCLLYRLIIVGSPKDTLEKVKRQLVAQD